jgi:hypothetical protein
MGMTMTMTMITGVTKEMRGQVAKMVALVMVTMTMTWRCCDGVRSRGAGGDGFAS